MELKLSLSTEIDFVVAIRRGLPSVPDPRSCIGSLSALGPVHDLIANDVVAQSISGSATEGKESSTLRYSTFDNFVGGNTLI